MCKPFQAIVVDDCIVFRKAVRDSLAQISGVNVVDVAKDGPSAIEKIKTHRPDLVTLDIEMPGANGLEVLQAIRAEGITSEVIVISSLTQRGAEISTKALQFGAFDVILKPESSDKQANLEELSRELAIRVKSIQRKDRGTPTKTSIADPTPGSLSKVSPPARRQPSTKIDAVVIGISTGGPQALRYVLTKLPAELSVPVLIVQHMPPIFTATMAADLDKSSSVNVFEAQHGMRLDKGCVYIAPGGKHMRVGGYPGAWRIEVTDDPPRNSCKPSVDYMFESAASHFGPNLLGIVMTGMGNDGLEGCKHIADRGGCIWAQSSASCTIYGMPRQIVDHNLADQIVDLDEIAQGIAKFGSHLSRSTLTVTQTA